jgi:hypothetical protein
LARTEGGIAGKGLISAVSSGVVASSITAEVRAEVAVEIVGAVEKVEIGDGIGCWE